MSAIECARQLLRRHEGLKLKPYKDTVGKTTIGYGRNLDDKGLSEDECEYMLINDIKEVIVKLGKLKLYSDLSDQRKAVLINMAVNLGYVGLMGFRRFLMAVEKKQFVEASEEMLNSRWAKQVGNRALELAAIIRGNEYN